MESYKVFILKDGPFYWNGRKWCIGPYESKCYPTRGDAETALILAKKKAEKAEIVEGSLKV
jgi:hypothetical protein